ncbi:DUF7948 domain-containing protein [Hymenobacter radiodurans]|uniref:DUF7948 domain-containing protein n=1 Tax=Hymenobacter radiodurans TaxID=2496028 RepID=UPI001058F5D7|nr:gliding motility-associated C-terminal domain-containing protein [Hymenobacter radiodurans]
MSIFTPAGRLLVVATLCLLSNYLAAENAPRRNSISFIENKSQWPAAVRFKASVPGGDVYVGATGLVYDWHSAADVSKAHADYEAASTLTHPHPALPTTTIRGHAVFVDFVGAQAVKTPAGDQLQAAHHNYFLGNDPAHWASNVRSFSAVEYPALYPGVGLRLYGTEAGNLKYDFTIAAGASPAAIALLYRGALGLDLRPDGTLLVRTSVTDVEEQKPYAYQTDAHGVRQTVVCRYQLTGSTVRYEFPAGYDRSRPLIIDPTVVACTFSGSRGSVWGETAGYDKEGNIFTGGLAQTSGYPITPGAYQNVFAGSQDIAISKLNPTGSTLLYATYLGGNNYDEIRSLTTTPTGELYLLAHTTSSNFPTTAAFDRTLNGGNDLVISKLNATGSALLASTYYGGSGFETGADLALGASGALYIVGNTSSINLPLSPTAYDQTLGGNQDVFVACFDANLTSLTWSTLLGGNSTETVTTFGITSTDEVVVGGSTLSIDFPTTAGALTTTYRAPGEAFISRLQADGRRLAASTFYGSPNGSDNITNLQLDKANNVYIFGNTSGTLAATPGAVSASNSSTFITKLAPSLADVRFTARPAMGPILSTAFGLDACNNIYAAGFTPTPGLPLINALPNNTIAGYYSMTLSSDASKLLFGSYFGNTTAHAHSQVHRFDSQGRLYQVLCAFTYPTIAGAYSPTNRAGGLDVLAFKIDQNAGSTSSPLQAAIAPVDSACAPYAVRFANASIGEGKLRYRWNFGDGTPADTARQPSHTFTAPGLYRVQLSVMSPNTSCGNTTRDSTIVLVRVKALPTVALPKNLILCAGNSLTINANSPGNTYRWSTGATTPTISVTQPGKYSVIVNNGRCSSRDSTIVRLVTEPTLTSDTTGCIAGGIRLRTSAEPGSTYLWSTQETTPSIMAPTSGRYTVRITQSGCATEKSVTVTLLRPVLPPNIITPNGDGKNDVFKPSEAVAVEPGTRLRLYNRWGKEVYASDNYANDWMAAGQPAGIYYYTLENERFCTPRVKGWLEVVK